MWAARIVQSSGEPGRSRGVTTGSTPEPRLYTYAEASKLLGISKRTLRRRVDLGLIKIVRMGPASPRVSAAEIQRVARDGAQ